MENWLKIHENKVSFSKSEVYSRLFVMFNEEDGYVFAQIKSSFQFGSCKPNEGEIQIEDIEMAKSLIKSLQERIDKIENFKV